MILSLIHHRLCLSIVCVICALADSFRSNFRMHSGYCHAKNTNLNLSAKFNNNKRSKSAEVFIRSKRLGQVLQNGGSYQSFLSETYKYDLMTRNSSDQSTSMMESVLRYSHQRMKEKDSKFAVNVSIAFLPDQGVDEGRRWFYQHLLNSNRTIFARMQLLSMPNIHDYNTKRFEQLWMNYMRGLNLSHYSAVVAHGTSAEALLRYMESEPIQRAVIVDGTDIYTAGERHGRAFLYSRIVKYCPITIFVSTEIDTINEGCVLAQQLGSKFLNLSNVTAQCAEGLADDALYIPTQDNHNHVDFLTGMSSAGEYINVIATSLLDVFATDTIVLPQI